MTTQVYFTRNSTGLTVFMDGRSHTLANGHPNYDKVLTALRERKYDKLPALMSIAVALETQGVSKRDPNKRVYIQNGKVWYSLGGGRREELGSSLVTKVLKDFGEGFQVDNLLRCLEKLEQNPREFVKKEFYDWAQSGNMVICEDGDFLAYKKVSKDFTDLYTGKVDHRPGAKPKRIPVDTNRHNTCSYGYHFCSLKYLGEYGTGTDSTNKVVIVKINPADIGAIPTDYHNQKGRCETYEVIGEYKGDWRQDAFVKTFARDGELESAVKGTKFTPDHAAADADLLEELMAATVDDMWSDLRKELVTDDGRIWVYKASEDADVWQVVKVGRHATRPVNPLTDNTLPYTKGVTVVRQLSVKTKSAAEALKRLKGEFKKLADK